MVAGDFFQLELQSNKLREKRRRITINLMGLQVIHGFGRVFDRPLTRAQLYYIYIIMKLEEGKPIYTMFLEIL